ncbi:unnamed protein product [Microthlaspi erraticum]|uniref:non-specific serine/threonine protein kinase n=1 Tax=Microthlaspi erraticum TaxID=1685480 RepID=A0A6D2IXJ1_9BRAS|nr:unnamed protein product [Microthlaspi erraticum]
MTSRQLLFTLLGIFAIVQVVFSQDQEGFISLDCGLLADEPPYTDASTKLSFSSDAKFVDGGKSGRLPKALGAGYMRAYTTLRYFPDGTRNCYNLNVTQGTRYLVRAVFLYGNYDGLNIYPTFDLHIGRNWWATVSDNMEDDSTFEEIIHIATFNTLHVCLVKTHDASVPFISALELRPLSNNFYVTQNRHVLIRVLVRYPDDVHDRMWISYDGDDELPTIKNGTAAINVENYNPYDLPQAAIMSAAIPANVSSTLVFSWGTSSSTDQIFIYIHFVELQVLRGNETRTFDIVVNGNNISQYYSPKKSMVDTVYNKVPFSCDSVTNCSLELRKTPSSTLPPLVNAIEFFTVVEIPESATNENDVIAIDTIRAAYALSNQSGDPCVPKPSIYLQCSNYTDPSKLLRIISLNLSSTGLSGIISPAIVNLTKLQVLDLSRNKLAREVPEFLAYMDSLLFLLHPMFSANTSSKKKFLVAGVASAVSIAIVLVVLLVLYIPVRRKQSSKEVQRPSIETAKRRFTYSEIKAMTNKFQRILGEGGFGIIYHGHLNDNQEVAVKVLSQSSSQGYKQFKAEVELLMRVHHINLVSLAGYCEEKDHLALVYEYMANRDLKEHLSGKEGTSFLDWPCRLRIAAEAALGLEYLHTGCKPPMIHRDVKSTNILLNEDFQAKIGDFGLSRSFPVGSQTHVSTVVVGTPGFLDPEYFQTQRLSEKSDVYSFGIVLLEIITNQLVIDQTRERPHIAEWVRFVLSTGDIESILDPNLKGNYESSTAWKVLELAMSCSRPYSAERPNMAQIVHELNECLMYENSRRGKSQDVSSKSSNEVNTSTEMAPMPR